MTAKINEKISGPGNGSKPTNKKDIARFERLSPQQKREVMARASELYDGTRTVARCWKIALANIEAS